MEIKPTTAFKKDIKSIRNNKKAVDELDNVLNILMQEKELPEKYKNHPLKNNWREHFDCHILPDLVLIYRYGENIIILDRIGSHSKLRLSESCIRLKIREDTACIPSKTSYMNEDGFYNGIYYFGEPKKPKSWRDFVKSKRDKKVQERMTNMIIKENDNDLVIRYVEVDSKAVPDSDGFMTDYTMYHKYTTTNKAFFDFIKNYKEGGYPDEWSDGYVFVLGDKELYNPYDLDDFDYECDSKQEAYEWFDDYNGFDDEDDEDFY